MQKLSELFGKICSASEQGKKGVLVDLQTISEIRDEFWALKQRAEAAEASSKEWRKKAMRQCAKREVAEANLAELAKQEPVCFIHPEMLYCVSDGSRTCGRVWGESLDEISNEDRLPLFTRPAPAADLAELVPDGWKLVPGEPTKEMVAAGQDRFEECIDSGFDSCEDGSTYEYSKISSDAPYLVYIAMLAAAPEVG